MSVSIELFDVTIVELRRSPPCMAAGFSSSVKKMRFFEMKREQEKAIYIAFLKYLIKF